MIPGFTREGQLPPGVYDVTLREIRQRFGKENPTRKRLMKGLEHVVRRARRARGKWLYVDGSFTTSKPDPADWDGALVMPRHFNMAGRDGVVLIDHASVKAEYGGDLLVVMEDDKTLLDLYVGKLLSHDREGREKGILRIRLNAKG